MENKLKIGKIPYVNLFPIYHTIQNKCDCSEYEFIEGVPSELNRMLREGHIDISPSSSIEYIRNPHLYRLIEGHSISCSGCIASILLFSKIPLEYLKKIYVTSQSETSIALLNIVLKKFYGIECDLITTNKPENSDGEAFFLIGDDALKTHKKLSADKGLFLVYDLGELWTMHTNLPFVFALWIARTEVYQDRHKKKLLAKFTADLDNAKELFREDLRIIGKTAAIRNFLTEDEIISYWNKISYDLNDKHKEALELFRRYMFEIGYL